MKTSINIGSDCSVEHDKYGTRIGTDMHMNGMDCFATIRTVEEAKKLIEVLKQIYLKEEDKNGK